MMSSKYALAILSSALLTSLGRNPASAEGSIHVTVTYVLVVVEAGPTPRVERIPASRTFTLIPGLGVSVELSSEVNAPQSVFLNRGKWTELTAPNGLKYRAKSTVANGAFVVQSEYWNFGTTIRIRTDQRTSCEASIEYKLRSGDSYVMEGNFGKALASDVHAENVTCEIH
jgi:hypothetical protein